MCVNSQGILIFVGHALGEGGGDDLLPGDGVLVGGLAQAGLLHNLTMLQLLQLVVILLVFLLLHRLLPFRLWFFDDLRFQLGPMVDSALPLQSLPFLESLF